MKRHTLFVILAIAITLLSGCYGSFALTRKVYRWNGTLGDKYVQSVVFWAFVILPVYECTTFIDAVVLNTAEFWLGSNPLALSESKKAQKIVRSDDKVYDITAGDNEIWIQEVSGPEPGRKVSLVYDEVNKTWLLKASEGTRKIASFEFENGAVAKLFYPDGKVEMRSMTR